VLQNFWSGPYFVSYNMLLFLRGIQRQVISIPYTVFLHRIPDDRRAECSGDSFGQQILFSIASCVLAWSASYAVAAAGFAKWVSPLRILAVVSPLFLMREFLRQFAFAHLRFVEVAVIDAIAAAAQVGGLWLLASFGLLTAPAALGVLAAVSAAVSVPWWIRSMPELRFRGRAVGRSWRRHWAFARWSLAGDTIGMLGPYFLPFALAAIRGDSATGALAAAATLVGVGQLFVTAISNAMAPLAAETLAREGVDGLYRFLHRRFALFGAVIGLFGIVVAAFGPSIASALFGGAFAELGPIQIALAFSLFASGLGTVAVIGLWVLHRPAYNLPADLGVLAVALAAAPWLVPRWSAFGAALTLAASALAGLMVRLVMLRCARRGWTPGNDVESPDRVAAVTMAQGEAG